MNTNKSNKLVNEKSPYLLQHAHNPVDWRPWGDEAFEEARRRDVPVFLSIGYSACHWCHVMERECFEDREVAGMLNANFVSVKVDREERPDVDHLYMEACTALTGRGGWPLSCFLDHDRRPFYAGTYFPKKDRAGMPGFLTVLDRLHTLWKADRAQIGNAASSVTEYIRSRHGEGKGRAPKDAAGMAYRQLEQTFDARYGGFGTQPKFPTVHNLLFLLRYGLAEKGSRAHDMASKTLEGMGAGGIFDHVGGGFCRYSTDDRWLVPHFEKMLYDNAMLTMALAEASAVTGNMNFADTARRTADYCIREMLGGEGGFFTAEDADSEGVEGKYYLWTPREVVEVLGAEDGERFCRLFDVTERGNFEGGSIPNHIGKALDDDDRAFALRCFPRLYERRNSRVHPFKDDKALASSNALMAAALAEAGRLLGEPRYVEQAERTARFVLDRLVLEGRLLSSYRDGKAAHPATSDDYAYLLWALFELHQATHNPFWLEQALHWTHEMLELFWDSEDGALFLSGGDVTDLPLRQKNINDGALPSGNSVAALTFLRLARATGREEYEARAEAILRALEPLAGTYPAGSTALLAARLYMDNLGTEVVVAAGRGLEAMLGAVGGFLPFTVVTVRGPGYERMDEIAPSLTPLEPLHGAATAYICSRGACRQPLFEPKALAETLKGVHEKLK